MKTRVAIAGITISEFQHDPARAFKRARKGLLVVLSQRQPLGYIVSPKLMQAVLDRMADHLVSTKAVRRVKGVNSARPLNTADF